MNRREQRFVEWEKKHHNRVYRRAREIWKESTDPDLVLRFLFEQNWTNDQALGYLTNQLELSLEEGKTIIQHFHRHQETS